MTTAISTTPFQHPEIAPIPITPDDSQSRQWNRILSKVIKGLGAPDLENVNATGQSGLQNQWQTCLKDQRFNAHDISDIETQTGLGQKLEAPVIFSQSPSKDGRGTATSALSWLRLSALHRSPIFQFVHPRTLQEGSYRGEASLIELIKQQGLPGEIASIEEVTDEASGSAVDDKVRCRRFKVTLPESTRVNAPHNDFVNGTNSTIEVILFAHRLEDYLIKAADIKASANEICRMRRQSTLLGNDGKPIVMSYGGFGRSSCAGICVAAMDFLSMCPDTRHRDYISHIDQLIVQGKSVRSQSFVPSKRQYDELKLAIESIWIDHQKMGAERGFSEPLGSIKTQSQTGDLSRPPLKSCVAISPAQKTTQELARKTVRLSGKPYGPYMPIHFDGIDQLANTYSITPPENSRVAFQYSRDIMLGGFYGDALGSEMESFPFALRLTVLRKKLQAHLRDVQVSDVLAQLRKSNLEDRKHGPTDDTQQGVLACQAAIAYADDQSSSKCLPLRISDTFATPCLRGHRFQIFGGAETIRMVSTRRHLPWEDRPIESLGQQSVRAGSAGNGGLMRAAYDLIALLKPGQRISTQEVISHTLLSNQVTHPSSLSAVACVGHNLLIGRCLSSRQQKPEPHQGYFFLDTYHDVAATLQYQGPEPSLTKFGLMKSLGTRDPSTQNDWRASSFKNLDSLYRKTTGRPHSDFMEYEKRQSTYCAPRFPSEFLKAGKPGDSYQVKNQNPDDASNLETLRLGSVEHALNDPRVQDIRRRCSRNEKLTMQDLSYLDNILNRWGSNSYLGASYPSVVFLLEVLGYGNPLTAIELTALLTKDSDTCAAIVGQVVSALHGTDWIRLMPIEEESSQESRQQETPGVRMAFDNVHSIRKWFRRAETPKQVQVQPRQMLQITDPEKSTNIDLPHFLLDLTRGDANSEGYTLTQALEDVRHYFNKSGDRLA